MPSEPTMREALRRAQRDSRALLAANFYNFETLQGILEAAAAQGEPVILQLTRSSIDYMGLQVAVAMARAGIRQWGAQAWLHLDHGGSAALAQSCLAAGFDSVMIDGSELPLEDNIALTRTVVELARATGASVEAELGFVAKLGQAPDPAGGTDPAEAARFVRETGVDALAVAIGTAHGFYKAEPVLDLALLERLRDAAGLPLVLHGGSGISEAQIRAAVARGICKVNVATETKNAFVKGVQRELAAARGIDLRTIFPPATADVRALIQDKLRMLQPEAPHA